MSRSLLRAAFLSSVLVGCAGSTVPVVARAPAALSGLTLQLDRDVDVSAKSGALFGYACVEDVGPRLRAGVAAGLGRAGYRVVSDAGITHDASIKLRFVGDIESGSQDTAWLQIIGGTTMVDEVEVSVGSACEQMELLAGKLVDGLSASPRFAAYIANPGRGAVASAATPAQPAAQAPAVSPWPSLGQVAVQGGGEADAALIVGIERYAAVPAIPGAADNARDWYTYLTHGLGLKPERVRMLLDNEATEIKLRKHAAEVASLAGPKGRVWFVFIGHGAPAADGKDGILVGFDAQQDVDSLYARSVPQRELLALLSKGRQEQTIAVIDACFSGRTSSGAPIAAGLQPLIAVKAAPPAAHALVLTAGSASQFAGPLPGANRPAFSYLALGALRGWADSDKDGRISADELVSYTRGALSTVVKGRTQTPELSGSGSEIVAHGGKEAPPDLGAIVLQNSRTGAQ